MRNSIGYYAGFLMLLAVLGGVVLAVVHVVKVVRKVRTLISRATDESAIDVQPCGCPIGGVRYSCLKCRAEMYGGADPVAIHADRAIAITKEENPLLREIYAAQSLAREGVDVYSKAPKEMAP